MILIATVNWLFHECFFFYQDSKAITTYLYKMWPQSHQSARGYVHWKNCRCFLNILLIPFCWDLFQSIEYLLQIVVQKLLLFTEHEKRKRVPKFLETAEVFKNKAVIFVSDKGEKISFQSYTVENGGKTTVPKKGWEFNV